MSESDDSHDIPALRDRLKAARARLGSAPPSKRLEAGPVDPSTGESWHRGHVLGHMSEMMPYWIDQVRRASAGSREIGRDQDGYQRRRQGIDRGGAAAEAELQLAVDEGLAGVLELLDTLSPADLDRTVIYHSRDGDREARIGELLQTLLVAHVEGHLEQLDSLS
jgi:DinB superfamily